jgi:hypothetical protein
VVVRRERMCSGRREYSGRRMRGGRGEESLHDALELLAARGEVRELRAEVRELGLGGVFLAVGGQVGAVSAGSDGGLDVEWVRCGMEWNGGL